MRRGGWRYLGGLLALLLLLGCGAEARPTALPSATPASQAQLNLFPHALGPGPVVSATDNPHFDLQRLGAERAGGRLILHLALYNNHDEQGLSFDAQALFEGARLHGVSESLAPERVEVERGNSEPLPPRSGVVAHLYFPAVEGDQWSFQLPSFPEQPLDMAEAQPGEWAAPDPLPSGRWQDDKLMVASHQFTDIGLKVLELRVQGERLSLTLGIVNLRDEIVIDASSTLSGQEVRLVDGQGLAYVPIEVEAALAEDLLPQGEWYPGESHSGQIHFPRPTTAPLRLELPTFPTLVLQPKEEPLVALASEAAFPPQDNSPLTLKAPPPLPDHAQAGPISYDQLRALLEEVAVDLAVGEEARFLAHFSGEAQAQMARWWPGIESSPLQSASFTLQRRGVSRGTLESGARYLLFYQLTGDSAQNRFMLPVTLDFGQEGGAWRITRWESDPPLWAQPWQVSQSTRFLILTDPEVQTEAALLSAEAETAYKAVTQRLPSISPQTPYVMLVTATQERFTDLTERGHETQGVASYGTLIRDGKIETNSLRFVLNGASLADFPMEYRQRTMAHELVHLLLAPATRAYTPPWVVEGAATYFGEDIPWETLRPWLATQGVERLTLQDLTQPADFARWEEGESIPVQYAYSSALVAYLVEGWGQEAFLAFYQAYTHPDLEQRFIEGFDQGESRVEALRLDATAQLVQAHFGYASLGELESEFERWLLRRAAEQS